MWPTDTSWGSETSNKNGKWKLVQPLPVERVDKKIMMMIMTYG